MDKKIFITRKIPDIGIKLLKEKGYVVDINEKDEILSREEIVSTLKEGNYSAVITLLTDKIDSYVYENCPNVKAYVNYASGFDNLDLKEAKKHGIVIANSPATLASEAVAEHTVSFILALASRIIEADKFVRDGKYIGWDPNIFIGEDIVGKTIGLIGVGRIGSKVGKMLHFGFGMNIIYNDITKNEELEKECGAIYKNTIDEVLMEADIVSLHTPLLDSTRHLMNETRFKLMKPSSFLINTSRGPIIEETALIKALKEKMIAGAGLDVFEFEPKVSEELIKMPNVALTPHIASASIEARNEMAEISANNVIDFFEGKPLRNNVIQ